MRRIRLVSLIRSRASWAHVARKLCEALQESGAEVMIEEDDDGVEDPIDLTDGVKRALGTKFLKPDADLLIVRPERFGHYGEAPLVTGYMVFEANRWPSSWVASAMANLDLIVTPSVFCRDGLVASGAPRNFVEVLPHGIDFDIFRPFAACRDHRTFRILFVGTPSRRKGLRFLLDALATLERLPVSMALTIKTQPWPERSDADNDIQDKLCLLRNRGIEITIIEECFSETDMAALYRTHDVLCVPHMGEGFGLCVLEAMACARPVITTAWSGVCDFVTPRTGWPIDEFVLIDSDLPLPKSFPAPPDAQMVAPRVEALTQKIRDSIAAGPAERERRGYDAAMQVTGFAWSRIAERYLAMIEQRLGWGS